VYEKDYILRVIDQMGVLLRAMLNEIRAAHGQSALELSREALQLLLGLPPTVAETLTFEGYLALLSPGGIFDAERGRLVAEVLVRRVEALTLDGETAQAARERDKAVRLLDVLDAEGGPEDVAEAAALRAELDEPAPGLDDD
jgi:hypothetical protein